MPEIDLSSQIQRAFVAPHDWLMREGGWLVFARTPGTSEWVHFWPTTKERKEPEGIIRQKEVAEQVAAQLRRGGGEVVLMRMDPQA